MSLDDRILRIGAVLDRTGLSRATLYRKIEAGTFPRQIAISSRCAGWRESAIQAWIADPSGYGVDHGESERATLRPQTDENVGGDVSTF